MATTWKIVEVASPWIFAIIASLIAWVTVRNKVNTHDKMLTKGDSLDVMQSKLNKHEELLSSGPNGGVPFITEPELDKTQTTCQSKIYEKIDSIEETMAIMDARMARGDQCRSESREETSNQLAAIRKDMRKDMNDFQEKMLAVINPLVTQVAVNKTNIAHIEKDNEKKK